jgi:hypothetical protein
MRLNRNASAPSTSPVQTPARLEKASLPDQAVKPEVRGGDNVPDQFAGTSDAQVTVEAPVARGQRVSPLETRLAPASKGAEPSMIKLADEFLGALQVRRAPPLTPAQKMEMFQQALTAALHAGPLSTTGAVKASQTLVALIHAGPRPDAQEWEGWLKALPPQVEALLLQDNANRKVLFNASILWDYMPRADFQHQRDLTAPMKANKFKPGT